MNSGRSAALDLSRVAAAFVVFTGHLIFLPNTFDVSNQLNNFLSPIRTGELAVLYFFALSGFVLNIGSKEVKYRDWVRHRLLRLYPVYLTAWMFGLSLVALHKSELLNYKVLLLGVIGFQSLDSSISLVINGPLWSLSVEIVYAFVFYYLLKLRSSPITLIFLILSGIIAWLALPNSALLRALPYFGIGVLLSSPTFKKIKIDQKFLKIFVLFTIFFYIFFGARVLISQSNVLSGELVRLGTVTVLLFTFSRTTLPIKVQAISEWLGRRSFTLYAFHFPILLIFDFIIKPNNWLTFLCYLISSAFCSVAAAELAFRFIDAPATKRNSLRRA
jgi:peptidoglycan/LPS O-acetylase OafA/YrhL